MLSRNNVISGIMLCVMWHLQAKKRWDSPPASRAPARTDGAGAAQRAGGSGRLEDNRYGSSI